LKLHSQNNINYAKTTALVTFLTYKRVKTKVAWVVVQEKDGKRGLRWEREKGIGEGWKNSPSFLVLNHFFPFPSHHYEG
jgi:hypothetical protein